MFRNNEFSLLIESDAPKIPSILPAMENEETRLSQKRERKSEKEAGRINGSFKVNSSKFEQKERGS